MYDVLVVDVGKQLGSAETTTPQRETALLGKKIDKPGRIDNSTVLGEAVDLSIGADGVTGGVQQLLGNNPEQFSEAAAGALSGRIPAALRDGRLEAAAALALDDTSHVMLCGNPQMLKDAQAALQERGLRKHRRRTPGHITVESFW